MVIGDIKKDKRDTNMKRCYTSRPQWPSTTSSEEIHPTTEVRHTRRSRRRRRIPCHEPIREQLHSEPWWWAERRMTNCKPSPRLYVTLPCWVKMYNKENEPDAQCSGHLSSMIPFPYQRAWLRFIYYPRNISLRERHCCMSSVRLVREILQSSGFRVWGSSIVIN